MFYLQNIPVYFRNGCTYYCRNIKTNLFLEVKNMSKSRNRVEVPEAKEAMNKFKMEVANELGVPLSNGYNGNLTSAQNGSVGGEMVRKMIKRQEESMAGK